MTPEEEDAAGWLAQARAAAAAHMRERAARPNWGETRWAGPVPLPGAESNLGEFMSMAPWALAAMRAGAPSGPAVRATGMKETPRTPNSEATAQHIYEAMLGRTRRPGEQYAQPGSGWWNVAGQPIPKPTNVLPWLGAGGVGYGIYSALGGPEAWRQLREQPWNTPGTPEYVERQRRLAEIAQRDPNKEYLEATEYGFRRGFEGPNSVFGDRPLSRFALEPLPDAPY